MDDARIDQIRREVLSELAASPRERASGSLESRVAALEAAVAELARGSRPAPALPRGLGHPSLQVLAVPGGSDRCLMEPDKPCVQSHACRTLGY